MKVLHVFKDYYPPTHGGIELLVHEIVHGMDGVAFSVLTSSRSRRGVHEKDGAVDVFRAPEYARPTSTPVTPAWSRALRETDADLIHFHMPNPFGELAFLASRTRVPMLASYHADIVGRRAVLPLFEPFQQRVLGRARRVVVSSETMARSSDAVRRHADRIAVIPYGIDPARWTSRPTLADELRARHPGPLVVFLGRLAYYKGVEVLLAAMREVEATALIVGDGPKQAELRQTARTLGVEDRVVFSGEVADADRAAYAHAADVFVLPSTSRAEAFGIAMLEAMACGTPAISTELGTGTSWVNVDGETGLVVPPGDARALAAAVRALLADDALRARMGAAAARRVRERFTQAAMLGSLRALYESIASDA